MDTRKLIASVVFFIAILYFIFVLIIMLSEAGHIFEDSDFLYPFEEWTFAGLAVYLLFIILLVVVFFYPTLKQPTESEQVESFLASPKQVACTNCKTVFSIEETNNRPLEFVCPNCDKKGVLEGDTIYAEKRNVFCEQCGSQVEIYDDGKRPMKFKCPTCHHNGTLSSA